MACWWASLELEMQQMTADLDSLIVFVWRIEVVGFRCPDLASIPVNSLTRQFLPYPRYPVPGDCARLVTCVDYYPRLLNCGYGSVFNEYTLSCDDPENVPTW